MYCVSAPDENVGDGLADTDYTSLSGFYRPIVAGTGISRTSPIDREIETDRHRYM